MSGALPEGEGIDLSTQTAGSLDEIDQERPNTRSKLQKEADRAEKWLKEQQLKSRVEYIRTLQEKQARGEPVDYSLNLNIPTMGYSSPYIPPRV